MRKQIIVNSTVSEVRVALLENGVLAEIHIERSSDEAAAGNVYKGKVLRVLPGMQAAFVDLGLEKAAFLHASDILTEEEAQGGNHGRGPTEPVPIEKKLKRGEEIIVQIAKEPMGTKGARITAHVSLPGKYLVYMPSGSQIGVSKRIADERERRRLRDIVASTPRPGGGVIVRTAAEGLGEREIRNDIAQLVRTWKQIQERAASVSAPALLYSDLDVVLRCMRDMLSDDVDEIVLDSREDYERTRAFVADFLPAVAERVRLYEDLEPIFDRYGVEQQIERATDPKVWLKSGGYLVIDQGEALTMIDVNTGRYVGKRSQEETVYRTNLEAAVEIVSQLRLRNIGGIIIIDFIDMEEPNNRRLVMQTLEEALSRDKARSTILRISELGLVEMTRKRTRENLERLLSSPCPYCDGRGRIKSIPTVGHEILRMIQREAARIGKAGRQITVRANRDVIGYLYKDEEVALRALQKRIGKTITLKVAEKYHQEQYDIVAA
ncbi:MAG: Rne/Rng family ribonuclease [Candidatus Dadabacteria bacterium]|nr:MAG: Rne/Rng family ribonuclease [Candidatus Dadabacteria bacterium]